MAVADGDTITVMHDGSPERIRLYGIDTPEKKQKYGDQAKVLTYQLCNARTVRIVPTTRDRYGRTIGWVYVGKRCVNEELLRQGLAWHYKKYSSDSNLASLEANAKRRRIGLWADANPEAPWDYRRKKR